MSVLQKLFGAPRSPDEIRKEADAYLEEARGFALTNPREGLNALRPFATGDLESAIDFGAPLHARFQTITVQVLDAVARASAPTILPACTVYSDPPASQRDEIAARAAESDESTLFMRFPSRWEGKGLTLGAIEALWMLARDPWLAVIYLGEDYVVFRNPVFAEAVQHLAADLSGGDHAIDFNDVLVKELGLEEAPDLVTPCGFEVFAYRFRFPNGE